MKIQIQPKTYNMPEGEITATIADINSIDDNLVDCAHFSLQLQTADEININGQMRIEMSGTSYQSWDGTNTSAIDFVLKTKNLIRA